MPVSTQKWSIKYDKCVKCGRTEYPHRGRGLCKLCYERESRKIHKIHKGRDGWGWGRPISSQRDHNVTKQLTEELLKKEYTVLGKSLMDIAKEYSCSRQYILKLLKKYNIQTRSKAEARKLAVERKKLKFERARDGQLETVYLKNWSINRGFFKTWTPEMAYVLGFIYADGNLYEGRSQSPDAKTTTTTSRITITQKSPEILEKIKALMDCDKRLYETKNSPRRAKYILDLSDKEIFTDLLNLGLTPAKSLTVRFPDMPTECIRHFIRGCWDGDGSVYYEKRADRIHASYVGGSLEFIEGMLAELAKAGFPERTIYTRRSSKKKGNKPTSYSFRYHNLQCQQLYHYLYDNVPQSQYLKRKYDIFQSCLSRQYRSTSVKKIAKNTWPFCVHYVDENGKRRRRYFRIEAELRKFKESLDQGAVN